MWNKSGNLVSLRSKYKWLERLTGWLTQAMHHSWWKFTYILWWTIYVTPYNKKLYQVVNKKGVDVVHFVCLSCCFDMGLIHIMGQEVSQLSLLMIPLLLTMITNLNLLCVPSWVNHGVGTCIQGAWDFQPVLCQAHYSYCFHFKLNHSRCYDRGMRAWHQVLPHCNH